MRKVREKCCVVDRDSRPFERPAGRSTKVSSKIVNPRRLSWRTDSTSVTVVPRFPFPRIRTRPRYGVHFGKSGTRSAISWPPGLSTRAVSANARARSSSRTSDCRMPYGAITSATDAVAIGSERMSPRMSTGRAAGPSFFNRRRAMSSMGAERSIPMRGKDLGFRFRVLPAKTEPEVVTRPVPHPSSITGPDDAATTRRQNPRSRVPIVRAFSQS